MGWGNKAIEIRSVESGHLDGVFMHKKAQKLKFLCERNDKVGSILVLLRVSTGTMDTLILILVPLQTERQGMQHFSPSTGVHRDHGHSYINCSPSANGTTR